MFLGLQSSSLLIVGFGNFALALYVLLRNPKSLINWSFFIFVAGFSTWMVSLVLVTLTHQQVFNHFIFDGALAALLGLVLLAQTFPDNPQVSKRFWFYVMPVILLYPGIPLSAFIKGLTVSTDGVVSPILGEWFPLFAAVFSVYTLASFYVFVRRYRTLHGIARQQMQYFFPGVLLFFGTVLLMNLLLPVVGFYQFNTTAAIASFAFTTLTTYVIIWHGLFDLRFLLIRTISFVTVLVIFAILLAGVLFAGMLALLGIKVSWGEYIVVLMMMVVAMLAFQPLQHVIKQITNRLFFHGLYDGEQLLQELTRVMVSTLDLDLMTNRILRMLTSQMNVEKVAFVLVDDHRVSDVKSVGYEEQRLVISDMDILFHHRPKNERHLIYEEIEDSQLKELFHFLDISLAIPILIEKREIGVLVLGPKLSGEVYYQRDLNVLDIFASEAGIAIQNAKSFTEIRNFSNQLEHMVEERTKQLRASQQQELEEAQAIVKLKDEFVFVAAHELRTPVTVIRGFLEMVETSKEPFSPEIREHLKRIGMASLHLNQLINDLLEIARSDAGTLQVEVAPMDLMAVVKDVNEEVSSLAQEKNVTIKVEAPATLPQVKADAEKIKEVVINLIGNAIKYNRANGQITVKLSVTGQYMTLMVQDSGYGIPKDQQAKIFQKFFRASSPETKEISGTGLGLFICRMLVEKMGGTINFTSVQGQGSNFFFTLPLA